MSAEIACKQNILVTDFHLLKLLLVVLGFGSQTNVCGFSRQNICSVVNNVNQAQTNFIAYQNFGGYYGTTDEIYQQHSDKLYDLGVNIYCTRCHDHNPLLITNCSEY